MEVDFEVWKEFMDLIDVKEVGVVYVMGYFYVKVKFLFFWLKKFIIDCFYFFFWRNCWQLIMVFYIFYMSFIEVGMIYYVQILYYKFVKQLCNSGLIGFWLFDYFK